MIDKERVYSKGYYHKSMAISLFVHALIITFFMIIGDFSLINLFGASKNNIKILESAVRIDVVEMPKYTLAELKRLQTDTVASDKELEVESKGDKGKGEELDTMDEQENFIDYLKEMSKKKVDKVVGPKKREGDGKKEMQKKKELLSKTLKGELKSIILAGNKISSGVAFTGDASTSSKEALSEFTKYALSLPLLIKENWELPSYLKEKKLKCRVVIHLSKKGILLKADIFESSGQSDYDNRALKAINATAPFPELPKGTEELGAKGLILGFPL